MKKTLVIAAVISIAAFSAAPSFAASKPTAPKPSISISGGGEGENGTDGGGEGRPPNSTNSANSARFAQYQACLSKAGIKMPAFGGRRPGAFGTTPNGLRPSGAPTAPAPKLAKLKMTPKEQKAFNACASLRPKFNRGEGGGFGQGATTNGVAPALGTGAAYIACLNTQGLPVQSMTDVQGLDSQNSKVKAAMKACAGK
jgi:hypothetical protein